MTDSATPSPPPQQPAPSRLLAIMFTDIVKSTALQDQLNVDRYLRVIDRHDALLKQAVMSANGITQQDTGDGALALFPTASDAVRAALILQWMMHSENWSPEPRLFVRVGIHIGEVAEAETRQDGGHKLVGMPINLASRVMHLAQGSQILMTRSAFDDARRFIVSHPGGGPEIRWVPHGPYLFKDVPKPQEVFEVGAVGLSLFSPPPATKDAVPVSGGSCLSARQPGAVVETIDAALGALRSEPHRLRVVLLAGPGSQTTRQAQVVQSADGTVVIGGDALGTNPASAHVALKDDPAISPRHIRLDLRDRSWTIEDLGSELGTTVGGLPLRASKPVEYQPGTIVRTGQTTWTAVPAEWIIAVVGNVVIYGSAVTAVNHVTYHCGMPLLEPLVARNWADSPSSSLWLDANMDGLSIFCRFNIPALMPGMHVEVGCPPFPLRYDLLRGITEPMRDRLVLRVSGQSETLVEHEFYALSPWQWLCDEEARRTIAAFVNPHDAAVEKVVNAARSTLSSVAATTSYADVLASSGPQTAQVVARALYDCLAKGSPIHYRSPQLHRLRGSGISYQTIRPPHKVLEASHGAMGTCLDLSLLVASCLENSGLSPLIVLCIDDTGKPWHAVCGCWTGSAPGNRALLSDASVLRSHVERGHLFVIECTGLAEGTGPKLDFTQAMDRAVAQLQRAPGVFAVDVGACRPPFGEITPVEWPFRPEAAACLVQAERLASTKRVEVISISQLLAGLFMARGELTRWMCDQMKLDIARAGDIVGGLVRPGQHARKPEESLNFRECRQLAEELAWQGGSPSVREQDLWWAVLKKAQDRGNLKHAFKQLSLDLKKVEEVLAGRCARPMIARTLDTFSSSDF